MVTHPQRWEVCLNGAQSYQWGRGSWMAVRVPPHRPVDVNVLNKQRHQQIEKEQELK